MIFPDNTRFFGDIDEVGEVKLVWNTLWHEGLMPSGLTELSAEDADKILREGHLWRYQEGVLVPYIKPINIILQEQQDAIMKRLVGAVQNHLDSVARLRNYDGILSLCSYATSTDVTFSVEGQAGVAWRDACWRHCYQTLSDVQNDIRSIPTPDELVAELPTISWI